MLVEDEEELERMIMAYSPRFKKVLGAARQRILESGGIRHKDFWNEMEKEASGKRRKSKLHQKED